MLEKYEAWNECVWGNKVTLATSAHVVAGLGLGLLAYPALARYARASAYVMLGLSALAHVYALLTRCPRGLARRGAAATTEVPTWR